MGQELNLSSVLQNHFVGPVASSIGSGTLNTTDDLVNLLKGLTGNDGNLSFHVDPTKVTGGQLNSPGTELQFNLVFDATRTSHVAPDLGANAANDGVSLDPTATVTLITTFHYDFTFGLDLTPNLAAADAFFIRENTMTFGAAVQESNFTTSVKVGMLGAQIQGGAMNLNAAISVGLNNPDNDAKGNITLSELQNTNLSSLVGFTTTTNTLSASLPVVASLGGTTFGGFPNLGLASSTVFAGPAPAVTTNAGMDELLNFNNVTPGSFVTVLKTVGSGLQSLAPSLDVNTALGGIPYVDKNVSQVVDFSDLVSRYSRRLYDPIVTAGNPMSLAAGNRLSGDANFSFKINDSEIDALQFQAANQQVGESVVAFLNRTLSASLSGRIVFSAANNTLLVTAIDPAITKFSILISDRTDPITQNLGFEPGQSSSPVYKFDTVQSFGTVLAQAMGIPAAQVNPQYDATTHALSFHISMGGVPYAATVPMDFSTGLGPLTFLPPTSANFIATPNVSGTVGFDLSGLQTVLTGSADAPTNGQLSGTAHFAVTLNGASPVAVALAADSANTSIDDLVLDLNAAISSAGLAGKVTAGRSNNRITLAAPTGSTLQVTAAAGDPATTDMHLPGLGALPKWSQHVYLGSGTQFNIASQITDADISGPAALGILPVTLSHASASLALGTGATVGSPTHITDLVKSPATTLTIQSPTATLSGHFSFPVDPSLGVPGNNPPAFDLSLGGCKSTGHDSSRLGRRTGQRSTERHGTLQHHGRQRAGGGGSGACRGRQSDARRSGG